jgi:competence protein ComEA
MLLSGVFGLAALTAIAQDLPEGPGKAATVKVCGSCHGVDMVTSNEHTASEWNDVVNDMITRGAKGTDEELGQVVDYLARHFPKSASKKINVNTLPAKDLEARLELSAKEGEALVRYRERNGKFQSLEDLRKVTGLDFKKIEAKRERLAF